MDTNTDSLCVWWITYIFLDLFSTFRNISSWQSRAFAPIAALHYQRILLILIYRYVLYHVNYFYDHFALLA